ncbi:MAG: hypothetical protein NC311_13400 [Muribaculaceae bacterium]|nr:hypothetical protein [Muribaculaceae bacterium]
MHIEKLKDPGNGLDSYEIPEGYDPGSELTRASDLLYELLDASFRCSRDALETEINGHHENVQGIYWKCKDLLDQIFQHGDKAGFLAMSAIEQSWNWARPLLLLRVEDLLDNNGLMYVQKARELEAILADNPYKKIWNEKSELYVSILERIGFSPNDADFSDLTRIMDPLLDALSFYQARDGGPIHACRVRSGKPAKNKNPGIARAMCMFRSEKEIADAMAGSGLDSMIMFAGLEKTHAQVKDHFHEWYYGYADERQRNYMRNDHLTEEEYLSLGCDYTRAVYLGVKDGGNIWLVHMPWKGDMYSRVGQEGSEYYYGKRASYAPYQIFYKALAKAPEGTSMLAVKKDSYMLNELLDPLSMAWFPAFMDETVRHFFKAPDVIPVDILLPEEAAAHAPGAKPGCYSIVPVYSGVPAVCTWDYEIPEPNAIFKEPFMLELIKHFGISAKDLADVPVLPVKTGTEASFREHADEHVRKAYVRITAGKIADLLETRWGARSWMLEKINARAGDLIKDAGNGDCMPFMAVRVDGTPVLNPDGTPKMSASSRYPYTEKPAVQKTEMADADDESRRPNLIGKRVYWASDRTAGKPPVVWRMRPKTPEDYACMAGCEVQSLPEILRLSGLIREFDEAYKSMLPQCLSNEYITKGYGYEKGKSAIITCLCPVNICMDKKTHRSFPYFRQEKKKRR